MILDKFRLDGRIALVTGASAGIGGRLQLVEPKTKRSRRTLSVPVGVVAALRVHRVRQLEEQMLAGGRWHESGLVFTSFGGDV